MCAISTELVHAVALTSEPEDRLVKKLSRAVCALVTSPVPSAEPISESRLENDVLLPEVLLLEVLLLDALVLVASVAELSDELSRLVSESYADCAPVSSPELMALKRLSTSCPSALMPELLEVSPVVEEVAAVELVDAVLGVA